jgi:hypothetical protein
MAKNEAPKPSRQEKQDKKAEDSKKIEEARGKWEGDGEKKR